MVSEGSKQIFKIENFRSFTLYSNDKLKRTKIHSNYMLRNITKSSHQTEINRRFWGITHIILHNILNYPNMNEQLEA